MPDKIVFCSMRDHIKYIDSMTGRYLQKQYCKNFDLIIKSVLGEENNLLNAIGFSEKYLKDVINQISHKHIDLLHYAISFARFAADMYNQMPFDELKTGLCTIKLDAERYKHSMDFKNGIVFYFKTTTINNPIKQQIPIPKNVKDNNNTVCLETLVYTPNKFSLFSLKSFISGDF